jgi:hypothetical protein
MVAVHDEVGLADLIELDRHHYLILAYLHLRRLPLEQNPLHRDLLVARGHLYALAVAPDVLSDPELAALRSRVAAAIAASSFSVRRALSAAAHLGIP